MGLALLPEYFMADDFRRRRDRISLILLTRLCQPAVNISSNDVSRLAVFLTEPETVSQLETGFCIKDDDTDDTHTHVDLIFSVFERNWIVLDLIWPCNESIGPTIWVGKARENERKSNRKRAPEYVGVRWYRRKKVDRGTNEPGKEPKVIKSSRLRRNQVWTIPI